MALNKAKLAQDIEKLLKDMETRTENAKPEFAQKLANAIDAYVRTITVTSLPILVSPTGPVTGTITNTVS